MRYVLITGVSSGIGYATAKYLQEKGFFIFGSVRKKEDAERLETAFGENFKALVFDVTDEVAVLASVKKVELIVGAEGLFGLVNNAGIAVAGPLQYLEMKAFEHQLNVNVFGLMRVTQAFLPLLGAGTKYKNVPGRIVNIGSVSGIVSTPFVGAYAASKYAVEAISDALRRELFIHGIDVVLLQPGPIKTPIWQKGIQIEERYLKTEYSPMLKQMEKGAKKAEATAIDPVLIGKLIFKAFTHKRPAARYLISPNKWSTLLASKLPDKWLDRIFFKGMKKAINYDATKNSKRIRKDKSS